MIKHVVCFKFKPEVTEEQIKELEHALAALPGKIREIKEYSFGSDVIRSERSFDFALVSAFADLEALKSYSGHPDHLPVLAKVRTLSEKIVAVDFAF